MRKLLTLILLICSYCLSAQDYNRALGFRVGPCAGLTYKKFIDETNALESIISFKNGGVQISVIREFHHPALLEFSDLFFVYYGAGGQLGYYTLGDDKFSFDNGVYRKQEFSVGFGIVGILGIEYHFVNYPIAISLDYRPIAEIRSSWRFRNRNADFGISIYYTF